MVADSEQELHNMAATLGLKPEWCTLGDEVRGPHYDLSQGKREAALRCGAIVASHRKLVEVLKHTRRKP